ncbi:MAG: blue (type 1) copper domain protein [Actinomycetia bacterium]|nr:blue (type 1) copper domain protein [Actinomycetes bacterium]
MGTKRLVAVLAAMLLLVVGLTACGSDSKDDGAKASSAGSTAGGEAGEYGGSSGSSDSGAASGTAVSIKDFAFSPSTLKVKAGDEVTISNDDGTEHTFTLDDKSFDSGHIGAGKSVTHTFDSAGSYSYHCEIHSTMKGTVEVG